MQNRLQVEAIKDNEVFEYKGDIVIQGGIGKNATVKVIDGSVTLQGNVDKDSEVILTPSQNTSISVGTIAMNGVVIGGEAKKLTVEGNVADNVKIDAKSADININGNVGESCTIKSQSGDILVHGTVGTDSSLKSMSGDIRANKVGSRASLKSMSGDVRANEVGENARLSSMSGNIRADQAHLSADLSTMSGEVYKNGCRQRSQQQSSATVSISGFSMFSGGGGITTINGHSLNELIYLAQQADAQKQYQQDAPVRHFKK